jgi:hypothetical protein
VRQERVQGCQFHVSVRSVRTDVLRRLPRLKITDIEALPPADWHSQPADTG